MRHTFSRFSRTAGVSGVVLSLAFAAPSSGLAADGYPADYTASTPAEGGRRKSLDRVFAVSTYMTDKLEAAGGEQSPECYRTCLTVPLNEAIACAEANDTYEGSASCEQDAARKMAACDPQCGASDS